MSSLCVEARIERQSCNLARFECVLNEMIWFKHASDMVRLSGSQTLIPINFENENRKVWWPAIVLRLSNAVCGGFTGAFSWVAATHLTLGK